MVYVFPTVKPFTPTMGITSIDIVVLFTYVKAQVMVLCCNAFHKFYLILNAGFNGEYRETLQSLLWCIVQQIRIY